MHTSSTLSSKGQVTIPVAIRRHLKLQTNDEVIFMIKKNGDVAVLPAKYQNIASVVGAAGKLSAPLSWKEMKRIAYEDRLAEKK